MEVLQGKYVYFLSLELKFVRYDLMMASWRQLTSPPYSMLRNYEELSFTEDQTGSRLVLSNAINAQYNKDSIVLAVGLIVSKYLYIAASFSSD